MATSNFNIHNYSATKNLFLSDNNDTYFTNAGKHLLNKSLAQLIDIIPTDTVKTFAVAGGSFRSYFFKTPPTDLDIFLLSDRDSAKNCIEKIRDTLIKLYPDIEFTRIAHITLSLSTQVSKKFMRFNIPPLPGRNTFPVQLLQFSHDVNGLEVWPSCTRELISLFDIIPACFGAEAIFDAPNKIFRFNGVYSHPRLLESLVTKELLPNVQYGRVISPVMSLERFYKYTTTYGFKVASKEHMTIFSKLIGIPETMQISYDSSDTDDTCETVEF